MNRYFYSSYFKKPIFAYPKVCPGQIWSDGKETLRVIEKSGESSAETWWAILSNRDGRSSESINEAALINGFKLLS